MKIMDADDLISKGSYTEEISESNSKIDPSRKPQWESKNHWIVLRQEYGPKRIK